MVLFATVVRIIWAKYRKTYERLLILASEMRNALCRPDTPFLAKPHGFIRESA